MSAPVRFALVIHVSERFDNKPPHVSTSVQVWSEDRHIETVEFEQCRDITLPETADLGTVEGFAVAGARATANLIANAFNDAVETDTLHFRADLEKKAANHA